MVNNNPKTTPEKWLDTAKRVLIKEGVENVKIDRLAKAIGVSRGGFYYFFQSRDDLLDQLLKQWEKNNLFFPSNLDVVDSMSAKKTLDRIFVELIEEKSFDPAYDLAVRDWARKSPKAKRALNRVDSKRMSLLRALFLKLGYSKDEALVRARVTYYHQIGYYALGVKESRAQRLKYLHLYEKALLGE